MMAHPRETMTAGLDAKEREAFYQRRLDRPYFDLVVAWMNERLESAISADRADVLFESISARRFTNTELGQASDWVIENCRRPVLGADFINCPDLFRQQQPSDFV